MMDALAKRDAKGLDGELDLRFDPFIRRSSSGISFWVTLQVDVSWPNAEKSPYESLSIALDGFFSFPDKTSEEDVRKYVPTLCLVNLYGAARGILLQATGAFPHGPFHLPLVDMNKVVRQCISKRRAPSQDASARKKKSAPAPSIKVGEKRGGRMPKAH
jgi:preprotein translocase subunit SecB